jgi:hypothetical protein
MLLAFSAKPEELDILMLSLTFGNVEVQKYVIPDVMSLLFGFPSTPPLSADNNSGEFYSSTSLRDDTDTGNDVAVSETLSRSFITSRRSARGEKSMEGLWALRR